MIRIALALLVLTVAPALASESDAIAERAKTCWNLRPTDFGIGATVDVTAVLAKGLVTSVEIKGYSPDNDTGYAIATAAGRAVKACSPYEGIDGRVSFKFEVDERAADETISVPKPGQQ